MAKNNARAQAAKPQPAPARSDTAIPPQAVPMQGQQQGQQQGQPGQVNIEPQYIMASLQNQRDEANNRAAMVSAHAEQLKAEMETLRNTVAQQASEIAAFKSGEGETKQ